MYLTRLSCSLPERPDAVIMRALEVQKIRSSRANLRIEERELEAGGLQLGVYR